MKVLLDTNAFIWWVADDARLGAKARQSIASRSNDVHISNLSLFECAIKAGQGKLKIDFDAVDVEVAEERLLELRFDTAAARQLAAQASLPQADPFDAAIAAQAISKRMTLITSDEHLLASQLDGLQLLNARG